jgi:predicted transposase YbfD/YdcC
MTITADAMGCQVRVAKRAASLRSAYLFGLNGRVKFRI